MIEEAYVSFETAKLLKEKEFSERTIYGYIKSKDTVTDCCYCNIPGFPSDYNYNNTKIIGHYVCAKPTQQMAMHWLREVHNIFIEIGTSIDLNGNYHFNYIILGKECKYIRKGSDRNYEDTVEAAIQYSLKNLI